MARRASRSEETHLDACLSGESSEMNEAISEIHDRQSLSRALSGSPDDGRGSVDRKTSWYQNTRII
jgi:hypothetical protein